jgi:hypothetical protein
VCNRRTEICYDRFGPSIGLTEIFCGQQAAQRLLAALREQPAGESAGASFSPAEGVLCVREMGPCRFRGELHSELTAALYPTGR